MASGGLPHVFTDCSLHPGEPRECRRCEELGIHHGCHLLPVTADVYRDARGQWSAFVTGGGRQFTVRRADEEAMLTKAGWHAAMIRAEHCRRRCPSRLAKYVRL